MKLWRSAILLIVTAASAVLIWLALTRPHAPSPVASGHRIAPRSRLEVPARNLRDGASAEAAPLSTGRAPSHNETPAADVVIHHLITPATLDCGWEELDYSIGLAVVGESPQWRRLRPGAPERFDRPDGEGEWAISLRVAGTSLSRATVSPASCFDLDTGALASCQGRVYGPSGPVSHALVSLRYRVGSRDDVLAVTTDTTGKYCFPALPSDRPLHLEVVADGFTAHRADGVTIAGHVTRDVQLVPSVQLRGQVMTDEGTVIGGAKITCNLGLPVTSRSDGRFEVSAPADALPLVIEALHEADGKSLSGHSVFEGGGEEVIRVREHRPVSGVIAWDDGKPVAHKLVTAADSASVVQPSSPAWAMTDASGRFSLTGPLCGERVALTVTGLDTATTLHVDVDTFAHVTLPRPQTFALTVRLAPGDERQTLDYSIRGASTASNGQAAVTDGECTIVGALAPDRSASVWVRTRRGPWTLANQEAPAHELDGSVVDLDHVTDVERLSIYVVGRDGRPLQGAAVTVLTPIDVAALGEDDVLSPWSPFDSPAAVQTVRTDANGHASVSVAAENAEVVVEASGFEAQRIRHAGSYRLDVTMVPRAEISVSNCAR